MRPLPLYIIILLAFSCKIPVQPSLPEELLDWEGHFPQFNDAYRDSILVSSDRTSPRGSRKLHILYKDGSGTRELSLAGYVTGFCWSPRKWKIAYVEHEEDGPNTGLYIMDCDGSNKTKVSSPGEFISGGIAWSPDGQRIAYMEIDSVTWLTRLKTLRPDGSQKRILTSWIYRAYQPTWTTDSQFIIFDAMDTKLLKVSKDSSALQEILTYDGSIGSPIISPDGQLLAFTAYSPSGFLKTHLLTISTGFIRIIDDSTTTHNGSPNWSPDMKQLIYMGLRPSWNIHDVFISDIDGHNLQRITHDSLHYYSSPRWFM